MNIIRYSKNGFKAQYQSHHLIDVDYHLNHFNIQDFPEHLRYCIKEIHQKKTQFYDIHHENLQYGVWAFIEGHVSKQSLNHLKSKVLCSRAEISDETMVYDVNWESYLPITDEKCKLFGFFIPQSQMHSLSIL